MKQHYFLLLFTFLLSCSIQAQDLIITGVYDGPLSGGTPKAIELYVLNDISDLSIYGVGSANNGGGTDGVELSLEGSAAAGDFIYIASEQPNFNTFFGFDPDYVNGAAGINGDDAVELFMNDAVIDTFGDINVDGNGEAWEYLDGWASRVNETGPDGSTFVIANWSFSGPNENDDDNMATQATATNAWPIATYEAATTTLPTITFTEEETQLTENEGAVTLEITISESATVSAVVEVNYTNDENESFTVDNAVNFVTGEATTQQVTFTPTDNDDLSIDYYVSLSLTDITGATEGETVSHAIYVVDDEAHAPTATNTLGMVFSNNIEVNGAEIITFDAGSSRLFVSNAGDAAVEILDFTDPTSLTVLNSIVLDTYGSEVTSVSSYDGVVAVAVRAEDQSNGQVVFMDTDGTVLSNVMVGSLPDMLTFTPDGSKVLVANEGEPNADYTVDPEGSVSIIDLAAGAAAVVQDDVTSLSFTSFDSQFTELTAAGVRIYGPGATVSQDLEPEYITVSDDGATAYVSLQENNAYAVVDIAAATITSIIPYGYKDHQLPENAIDTSNSLDFVFMSTWQTLGMYQPDAIANYTVDGTQYLVIANEGDSRDYDGYSEEERVKDLDLDPIAYPNASILQQDETLGRLKTTSATGDIDGDGDIDQIYSYGGRSFAILNAETGAIVYDSGDLLERITSEDEVYGAIFNATDDENAFKNRSDDKGPEPEAVTLAMIDDVWYAFVGLERIGGVAVFNISDPEAPVFETYVNNRDVTPDAEDPAGDLAPEGIVYIQPEDNATNTGLIVVANEVSSTVSVYTLANDVLSTDDFNAEASQTVAYPNPTVGSTLYFTKNTGFTLVDILGRVLISSKEVTQADISTLTTGVYIVNFEDGTSQKIIKN
ncbi:MAG: hypothetical protein ACJAZZ_001548 [Dokdonia donghaensis]|jgi:hypothetical protein